MQARRWLILVGLAVILLNLLRAAGAQMPVAGAYEAAGLVRPAIVMTVADHRLTEVPYHLTHGVL